MRGVLISPAERRVEWFNTDGKLASLQVLIGGNIAGIYPGNFIPALQGVHGYVDDDGLWNKDARVDGAFAIGPYEALLGPAILLGDDGRGGEADCPVGPEVIAPYVRWMVAA